MKEKQPILTMNAIMIFTSSNFKSADNSISDNKTCLAQELTQKPDVQEHQWCLR